MLLGAISEGLALLTWVQDAFGFADSFDENKSRYRGLRVGRIVSLDTDTPGLIVKPEVAYKQLEVERAQAPVGVPPTGTVEGGGGIGVPEPGTIIPEPVPTSTQPKRFHGTVTLDTTRVGRDASRIADEVIAHLSGLVGSSVTVTLEVEAEIPTGAPDHVVRTVTENSQTLSFTSHGFEKE